MEKNQKRNLIFIKTRNFFLFCTFPIIISKYFSENVFLYFGPIKRSPSSSFSSVYQTKSQINETAAWTDKIFIKLSHNSQSSLSLSRLFSNKVKRLSIRRCFSLFSSNHCCLSHLFHWNCNIISLRFFEEKFFNIKYHFEFGKHGKKRFSFGFHFPK